MRCPYPHIVGDNKLKVVYWRNFHMNKFRIPAHAVRCVVLVPNATPTSPEDDRTHALTEDSVNLVKRTKYGARSLASKLELRFGQPIVLSGQHPALIMTAFIGGPSNQIKTDKQLDANCLIKKKVTFLKDTSDKQQIWAYASPEVIDRMLGSTHPEVVAARKPLPGIEAAILFLNKRNRIVGAHKHPLLAMAAA